MMIKLRNALQTTQLSTKSMISLLPLGAEIRVYNHTGVVRPGGVLVGIDGAPADLMIEARSSVPEIDLIQVTRRYLQTISCCESMRGRVLARLSSGVNSGAVRTIRQVLDEVLQAANREDRERIGGLIERISLTR